MGFVTVLVQHAWALQPTTARATSAHEEVSDQLYPPTGQHRCVSLLPESVTAFLHGYRTLTNRADLLRHDSQTEDILDRLHHIVTGPALANTKRNDPPRIRAATASEIAYKPAPGVPRLCSGRLRRANQSRYDERCRPAPATRLHALRARESLVAFVHAPKAELRESALEFLYEALECGNELRYDEMEMENLFKLLQDIGDALRVLRRSSNRGGPRTEAAIVDRLLLCLSMTVQRIDHAYDLQAFAIGPDTRKFITNVIDELQAVITDDPFMRITVAFTEETLTELYENRMSRHGLDAIPTAILSQTLRAEAWPDPKEATERCLESLVAAQTSSGSGMVRRLLEFLAAGAARDEAACRAFLACLKSRDLCDWRILFFGTMLLAAVAQDHEQAVVGSLIMEGLLYFLHFEPDTARGIPQGEVNHIRTGALLALAAVWKHCQTGPLALIAVEAIRQRQGQTSASPVESLLICQRTSPCFRMSHLFTYKTWALAEHLIELRDAGRTTRSAPITTRWRRSHGRVLSDAPDRRYRLGERLGENVPLSTTPYHRTFLAGLGISTLLPHPPANVPGASLAPSFLTSPAGQPSLLSRPNYGTANRRKLFDAAHFGSQTHVGQPIPRSDRITHTLPSLHIGV